MTRGMGPRSARNPGTAPSFGRCPARWAPVLLAALCLALLPGHVAGQRTTLPLSFPGGEGGSLPVERHRGYPAIASAALAGLGWERAERNDGVHLTHRSGLRLEFREGSPFFRWDGELVQLVHSPYRVGSEVYLPIQLVTDLFPGLLPDVYRFDGGEGVLRVATARVDAAPPGDLSPDPAPPATPEVRPAQPAPTPAPREAVRRLVVIDPGHGGEDPGAIGPGGVREKDVALAIALALARELEGDPTLEVRLTRDQDVLVPIWERGLRATEWKGDRPGIFLSIHANALPDRPTVRGFETYFLSEARTEHERRVAAAENAPLRREAPEGVPMAEDPLLATILRDLITFDHQHWSALLAEMVQRELGTFHPGPNRGVKQGPFAVITNALMPSVLVEVGFISHRDEERLMTQPEFHRNTARALARSVRAFFQRYPPGMAAGS